MLVTSRDEKRCFMVLEVGGEVNALIGWCEVMFGFLRARMELPLMIFET